MTKYLQFWLYPCVRNVSEVILWLDNDGLVFISHPSVLKSSNSGCTSADQKQINVYARQKDVNLLTRLSNVNYLILAFPVSKMLNKTKSFITLLH